MAVVTRAMKRNAREEVKEEEGRKKKKEEEKEDEDEEEETKKAVPLQFPLPLPEDLYYEIAKHVNENEALAFAMTSRGCRDAMKETLKERKGATDRSWRTSTTYYGWYHDICFRADVCVGSDISVSEDWIKWAFSMKWEYAIRKDAGDFWKEVFLTYLAARSGFTKVLGWLRSAGYDSDYWACNGAVRGGHIKVLKYLKGEGVKFGFNIFLCAGEGGDIRVLKYLKSEGMSFDASTCADAAEGGNLEVLKWLRSEEVNCPWNPTYCLACALHGRSKDNALIEWIRQFISDDDGSYSSEDNSNSSMDPLVNNANGEWIVDEWINNDYDYDFEPDFY